MTRRRDLAKKIAYDPSTERPIGEPAKSIPFSIENVTYVDFTAKIRNKTRQHTANKSATSSTESDSKVQLKTLLIDHSYDRFRNASEELSSYFQLDYASDSFSALAQIQAQRGLDLILCRKDMPFIAGLTLFSELRKRRVETPFFLFSDSFDEKTLKNSLHLGVHNVVRFPFSLTELVAKIEAVRAQISENHVCNMENQEKGYICNILKNHYYEIEKILLAIEQLNIPQKIVNEELEKKERTGKCIFDDLHKLRWFYKGQN